MSSKICTGMRCQLVRFPSKWAAVYVVLSIAASLTFLQTDSCLNIKIRAYVYGVTRETYCHWDDFLGASITLPFAIAIDSCGIIPLDKGGQK